MQLAIWTGQLLHPDVPLYNMSHSFRIRGALDGGRFREAFEQLVAGTDVLRAVVRQGSSRETPQLEILDAVPVRHTETDLTTAADPDRQCDSLCRAQLEHRYVPGEPLYESLLIRMGPADYVWCLTGHHVIVDFLSIILLYERMSALYEASSPERSSWPEFVAFMDWTATQQDRPGAKRAERYWERQLGDADPVPLELFGNALTGRSPRSARLAVGLGAERSRRLRELALAAPFRGLSPELGLMNVFATLLYAFLYRHSNRDRITLGAPLHNRGSAAFRDTVGLLINVLPITESLSATETFASLAGRVSLNTLDATKYAPFAAPRSELHRGFDAVLNFLTGRIGDFAGRSCEFTWHHSNHADAHHALRLQVQDFEGSGEYTLYFDVNADLLAGLERHRLGDGFLALLDACLDAPETPILGVDLLPDADRGRLLAQCNDTEGVVTQARSLNELLAPRWTDAAGETAVQFGEQVWTYARLDERVREYVSALADAGVGAGQIVALSLQRSPDFVAAILAVLRIGAAYLPVDAAQPLRRAERILEDARPALLIAEPDQPLANTQGIPVLLPAAVTGIGEPQPALPDVPPDAAAYVIYTSGSTGEPKGVVIEHRGIVNYVAWAVGQYVTGAGLERPAMPFYSSTAVDLTLTSIFVPLASGGRMVVYEPEDPRNDLSIVDVFTRDEVDIVKLTPAHLSLLQGLGQTASRISTLILGGENLTAAAAHAAMAMFPRGVEIYNEYGPTETVVGCMIHRYDPATDAGPSVPIGAPISNMRVYALDRHGLPVAPGMRGELYIAGIAVARGYLNREALTRDSFPALERLGEQRVYRSGDLVRFDAAGVMSYLGRADDQLKIRGNRVEPGEIEACMQAHPSLRSAAVIASERERPSEPDGETAGASSACRRCGLPENYPQADIDPDDGICALCRHYERHRERIDSYFRSPDELRAIVADIADGRAKTPNAIVLASGGKDSTYALHQLVRLGLTPLVFTLDNGYISEQALANVRRVVDELGLELVVGRTPHMNAIFADSLQRHCNVCNGCFKTIYTLGINLALERGIGHIFTGLSRGQLFETRLAPAMFSGRQFSVETIERDVALARVAYHRRHDAVNERLDVGAFADDSLFTRVRIIDFYRYWDVDLSEMLDYLAREVSWLRPSDTGRSTNCLINDAGISVHKARRGYHNYALPYSWDVRLGHKTREQAVDELDDSIDPERVRKMLDEVGYVPPGGDAESMLTGVYTADEPLVGDALRVHLEQELPSYMIPNRLVQVDALPLTPSGKVDRRRLAELAGSTVGHADDTAARNEFEEIVAGIWRETLGIDRLGVHENFFDLGGTSLPALQIVARASQLFEIDLPLPEFFAHPTVAGVAAAIEGLLVAQLDALSDDEASEALSRLEAGENRVG